jgi:hypothetical protein
MEEYIDTLKEFYETKSKLKKSKNKSKRVVEEIEKMPYYYNKEYLKMIEDYILEEKNNMLRIKYNILYGLAENENDLEQYDEIEEKIKDLRDQRDKIKLKIEHKENRKKKEIKKIKDDIDLLMFSYKEVPEDRKEIYKEIQFKKEKMNDILNNDRTIILKELNKVKIYTVVTDYEPIRGNEIIESHVSNVESNATIDSEKLD